MAKKQDTPLSEKEVNQVLNAWNFLDFAKSYRGTFTSGYYTPDIVNQQMKNITMNPIEATVETLESALQSPKESEEILRNYSETAELKSMYYKRLIRYYSDMALFNMTFDCINAYEPSDYKSKEFQDDLRVLDDFTSHFDYRQEFATVLRQLFRQGVFYGILRNDGLKYTLQELPANFCKITGRFTHGLLFDFDMSWFISNYGVDIEMYPPIFKKKYRQVVSGRNAGQPYDPARKIDMRNTSFVYWTQCSPDDGFWCWKVNPEIATIVPYFSPLFPEIDYSKIIRGLQYDKNFIEASKLLVGIIGFNKEAKTGQVANQINMTPDMLGKFLGVARQGLNRQIGLVALPVEDIKIAEFDTPDKNIYNDDLKTIAEQSTSSADALFSDEKLNSHQSKLASAIDTNVVFAMYPMFASFIEFYVNKLTSKYKFKVTFNDFNIPDDKAERRNRFKELSAMGLFDIQQTARVVDMNAFEFNRSLMMSNAFDIKDKLTFLMDYTEMNKVALKAQQVQSNTPNIDTPKQDDPNPFAKRGRPAKPESDNDNTEASNARGSNELKVE